MPLTQNLRTANPNTIVLRGKLANRYEEKAAASAISPGMLAEIVSSTDTVQPHSTRGGRMMRYVAMEAYFTGGGYPQSTVYTGGTITDAYQTNDLVRLHLVSPGDEMYMLLHVGETIVEGDWLISYGDGTLCKAASSILANVVAASTPPSPSGTAITAFSNGTVAVPAGTLKVGDQIRIRAQGDFPATHSTDTVIITVKIGTTVLVATAALDVANNDQFLVDVLLTVRTIGATGTFVGFATTNVGTGGTTTTRAWDIVSTSIDTTVAQSITVNFTWSVSDAGNQAVLNNLTIEQIKGGVSAVGGAGAVFGQANESLDLSAAGANGFLRVMAA